MKRLLLFATVVLCFGVSQNTQAQSKRDLRDIESISFYGVDFSLAKIYGSEDTLDKLLDAFARINDLFESEPHKYDIPRTFGVESSTLYNYQAKKNVNKISSKNLFTDKNQYQITDAQIDKLVGKIKKEGDSEYGAVIVTGLLNKIANQGTFTYVVFEQDTNRVIFQQELTGKAKGFGLRNFWAGALYATMKRLR